MTQRQEVNLYLPHLQPKVDYLAPGVVVRGLAALLLIMVATACFDVVQNIQLQQQLDDERMQVDQLADQIEAVKEQLPESQAARLDKEIQQLGREVKRRKAISRLIDGQSIGNTDGFSEQLQSLARESSAQLALTGFEFSSGGDVVSLQGETRHPESVPYYVARLRDSDSFSNSLFGTLSIEREENTSRMQFSLSQPEEVNE